MEKKFKVLRIIGVIWKILAWIVLIVGFLASVGMLLATIFGGGVMRQFIPTGQMPWDPRAFGVVGGIVSFLASLIVTVMYFLALYAMGELIYLMLAIEENTRLTAQLVQTRLTPQAPPPAPSPIYPTPPPPPPSPTPPPPSAAPYE